MEGFVCVCDQRSFGIAHLGVKSSYFSKDSTESDGGRLCLWLSRFQLPSQAPRICFGSSWFVKGWAGADCHNSERSSSYRSYGESSPLVEKEIEIANLRA